MRKDDPIRKTILIVEDRISEILEESRPEQSLRRIERLRALKQLSIDLAKLNEGIF